LAPKPTTNLFVFEPATLFPKFTGDPPSASFGIREASPDRRREPSEHRRNLRVESGEGGRGPAGIALRERVESQARTGEDDGRLETRPDVDGDRELTARSRSRIVDRALELGEELTCASVRSRLDTALAPVRNEVCRGRELPQLAFLAPVDARRSEAAQTASWATGEFEPREESDIEIERRNAATRRRFPGHSTSSVRMRPSRERWTT